MDGEPGAVSPRVQGPAAVRAARRCPRHLGAAIAQCSRCAASLCADCPRCGECGALACAACLESGRGRCPSCVARGLVPAATESSARARRVRRGAFLLAWLRPIQESGGEAEGVFGAIDRLTRLVLVLLAGVASLVALAGI